ncbi:protease inhibitor I42 family protein [Pseudomonas fulva]|nr:protease inhibitor I42 family protein [Pseudomonas fulva]MBF8781446.1 protease inhibitor I42 family protein [Pseudomonas fulva]
MKIHRLFVLSGCAVLAACAQAPVPEPAVLLEDAGQCPIHLVRGQHLTLRLPSNPSTGYRWLLQQPAANILRSLGPEVHEDATDDEMVGGAGRSIWRFQAQAPGASHLILVYQQPWAPEVSPERTFDCAIRVR